MAKTPRKILTEKQLVALITKANKAYHDNDKPIMSDAAYDDLKDQLENINPNHALIKKVGVKPQRGKKVTLINAMGSLPKTRVGDDNLVKWLSQHNGSIEVTDKLDGISLGYGNHPKYGYYLNTRGNGVIGTDVSHLIPYIKGMGTLPKGHEVRGELAVTKADFRGKLSKEFENARNLAGGIVNRKGIHPAAKKATFIVHEYVMPRQATLSTVKATLKADGFYVVTSKTFNNPRPSVLESYLKLRMSEAITDIDGLVLNSKGERVALKDVNKTVVATIDHIEWEISRHGLMKPVAILKEAVSLEGVKVKRVTAHNARYVVTEGLGPGAVISISRSNQVIPKIEGVLQKAKPQLPPKGEYEWDGDVEIVTTKEDSIDQSAKILSNFLSVIGVKRFRSSMMSKLVDAGIDTVEKLIRATEDRFQAAGFGKIQAKTLFDALHDALPSVSHAKLSAASGIFPAGFGVRRMTAIFNATGTKLFKQGLTATQIKSLVSSISGVGPSIATDFSKYFPRYLRFVNSAGLTPKKQIRGSMYGKTFAFSGFRDKALEHLIESKGGQITGVNRNTTYLIVLDPNHISEKVKKAKTYDVTIITPQKVKSLLK